jgi:hypothetical protein
MASARMPNATDGWPANTEGWSSTSHPNGRGATRTVAGQQTSFHPLEQAGRRSLLRSLETVLCLQQLTKLAFWFLDFANRIGRISVVCAFEGPEGQMRSTIAVVSAVAMLVCQIPPGFAQSAMPVPQPAAFQPTDATPDPAIIDAFAAFPKGGEALSKQLADIIVKDPSLAPGLVKYVRTAGLNKDQKLAAERGLAAALQRLGIKAADLPVAPVVQQQQGDDYTYLLMLAGVAAATAGFVCLGVCGHHGGTTTVGTDAPSPH